MSARVAKSAVLDWGKGVFIDGHQLPWAVGVDIDVTSGPMQITEVHLTLLVHGTVVVRHRNGEREVHDTVLGDVGECARRFVRDGICSAHPWLRLPAVDR